MIHTIEEFKKEWAAESEITAAVLDAMTDASLPQAIAEGRRTLGGIAWHLAESLGYMASLGLDFTAPDPGQRSTAEGIAAEYRRLSRDLADAICSQWNDDTLLLKQEIAGELWSNGATLRFTLMHQAHHRGQLTVLMRQAGLRLPDVYGPSYDTWVDKGMTPLA
jgi:uncharacterized damage-inducible protein DinB